MHCLDHWLRLYNIRGSNKSHLTGHSDDASNIRNVIILKKKLNIEIGKSNSYENMWPKILK